MRTWLWKTMEYPHTSKTAQILAWFSLSMVLVSTFTFIVSTAEVFQGNVFLTKLHPVAVHSSSKPAISKLLLIKLFFVCIKFNKTKSLLMLKQVPRNSQ